jgi:hypothetical protein
MGKLLGLILLVIGLALAYLSYKALYGLNSLFSQTTWYIIAAVAVIVGLFMLFSRSNRRSRGY